MKTILSIFCLYLLACSGPKEVKISKIDINKETDTTIAKRKDLFRSSF